MRTLVLLLASLALAGCTVYEEPGPRDVEGRTEGYAPTATFLKVLVRTEAGEGVYVDFDRADWHVSELARRLDDRKITFLAVQGQERATLGEVIAVVVRTPEDVQGLNYDEMGATAQQRTLLDLEYEDLLRVKAAAERAADPESPTLTLP